MNDIVHMRTQAWSSGEPSAAAPVSRSGGSSAPRREIGERELIWMMAMLMALQAFGIDAILPALDDVALSLNVVGNDRQFVIGVYLLSAGMGALVPGALADRFGRRPIVLASIGVYIVLSLVSAIVTSFEALLAVRAAQGFFGAGIVALPPAIIRDRVGGDKMASMMSLIFVIFLMVPAVAPSLGEAILLVGDWRTIFAVMAVQGVLIGSWVYFRLPESLAPEHRQPIRPRVIARNMATSLSERSVIGYVIGGMLVFGALFGFINSSQQLISEGFGRPDIFPIIFGVCAGSMAIASWSNSRIVERFGARRVSHTAVLLFIAVAAVQVFFAFSSEESLWQFVPLMAVNMALLGFIGSNFGSIAMNPFFHIAGAASSAQSSVRMTSAALLGALIGYAYDGTARPLALALLASGIACLLLVLFSERGRLFGPPEPAMGFEAEFQAARRKPAE
jgi:DHA1 family bicyclomycin/chloramphenicol resistance-like MFS transporter